MKVLQSWDDGIVDDTALIEILRRHNARAAFCLNPGLHGKKRSLSWVRNGRKIWRFAADELADVYRGFEICSHSMTHPHLTDLPPDRLEWETRESRERLEAIFQIPVVGFAYPFNSCNNEVREALRAAGYLWARGKADSKSSYPPDDPLVFCPQCHFLDPNFWLIYENIKQKNGVFFFWGHSYELAEGERLKEFEVKTERIASDVDAKWYDIKDLFSCL